MIPGPCSSGEWVVPDRGKGQRQGRGWWKGKCECRPGYTVTIVIGPDNENKTLCQAPTVVLAKFLNNKTNSYKYKSKQHGLGQETYQDESSNASQSNKYTTKLSNVRNNSKVTKLSSLRSTEEDRTKLVPVRSNNDRRNSRYKTNWETRELNRMKELQEKNRKEQEDESVQKGEQRDDNEGNHNEDYKNVAEQEGANNNIQTKDVSQDTTNEILRKINAINASHKQAGGTSRERSVSRRINSKELNVDGLSNGEQRLLGSQENGGNHRRGRKYNTGNTDKENLNENKENGSISKEEETFRNLKTIQDDINEYIRQEQKRQEQEDRLKNHKIIDQDENEEEIIDSLVEVVNKTSDEDKRSDLERSRKNADTRNNQRNIVDRRKNHKEEQQDGDDEFEDKNSTETLIMVEDKKKDLSDYEQHRKHIKDYVKPIIIFEQETY
ncbi:hypothetical protein WDU94_011147 [Cyamophila willieti]